jgi:hypothetical protein
MRDPAGETKRQANPELNGIIAQQKMEFLQTPIRKREFVAKPEGNEEYPEAEQPPL